MKRSWIEWSEEINRRLLSERGLCFEDVENAIEQGRVLDDRQHPITEKYPGQRVLVVEIDEYVCLVPYVADVDRWFLKTIYPSRKARRFYRGELK